MSVQHRAAPTDYDVSGYAHELVFSCHKRLPLLTTDRTCRWLVESINESRTKLGFELWAYVFMPEHVHLLVWPAASALSISGILWSIKQPVAKRAIHHYEKVASEWVSHLTVRLGDGLIERRFWLESGGLIRLLPEPKTIHAVIDEIHHNPVRRGLVATPSEWKWSSAGWYEGRRPVELEIDPTVPAV